RAHTDVMPAHRAAHVAIKLQRRAVPGTGQRGDDERGPGRRRSALLSSLAAGRARRRRRPAGRADPALRPHQGLSSPYTIELTASFRRRIHKMAKSTFWGVVTGIAATPVALAAGIAKGAYDAASGNGSFAEGVEKTAGGMIKGAEHFGEEHGDLITKG